jgi:hypothetical protein
MRINIKIKTYFFKYEEFNLVDENMITHLDLSNIFYFERSYFSLNVDNYKIYAIYKNRFLYFENRDVNLLKLKYYL